MLSPSAFSSGPGGRSAFGDRRPASYNYCTVFVPPTAASAQGLHDEDDLAARRRAAGTAAESVFRTELWRVGMRRERDISVPR